MSIRRVLLGIVLLTVVVLSGCKGMGSSFRT
jgi:hypothetical protein